MISIDLRFISNILTSPTVIRAANQNEGCIVVTMIHCHPTREYFVPVILAP